ncbi:hypothetical protein ACEYX8_09460 [Acinetobacter sp. c3-l95]
MNKISAPKEVIDALINHERPEKVDFNKVIAKPKIFDEFGGDVKHFFILDDFIKFVKQCDLNSIDKETLRALLIEFHKVKEFDIDESDIDNELVLQAVCYFQIGYRDPIDWSREFWGTQWNAYDVKIFSDTELHFNTAWTHPFPVIKALSEKFPNAKITVQYADEDLGYNCGQYTIQNGLKLSCFRKATGSNEDVIFAAKLKGYSDVEIEEFLGGYER